MAGEGSIAVSGELFKRAWPTGCASRFCSGKRHTPSFPSPLMGEGAGGGEAKVAVPPIPTFPLAGEKGA
jgi:hypothetical protein